MRRRTPTPRRRDVALSQKELHLVCDALSGYARWLEEALTETHMDLTKAGRRRRHRQRVDAAMLRGDLYRRWELAVRP